MLISEEKFFGHADIDNVPREHLVLGNAAVCVKRGINTAVSENREPVLIIEELVPCVKAEAALCGKLQ